MDELMNDKRFAHIARDPKFKRIPKTERKVMVDKRFQSMFKDKKFSVKYTIDKRGRPVNQTSSENLKKYYDLPSSEEEDEKEEPTTSKQQKKKKSKKHKKKEKSKNEIIQSEKNDSDTDNSMFLEKQLSNTSVSANCISNNEELFLIKPKEKYDEDSDTDSESESESESETEIDDAKNIENLKKDLKESKKQLHIRRKNECDKFTDKIKKKLEDLSVNYARGEGVLMTDSSSDEESSEASDGEEMEHNWGELDKEAETTDEITHRLAVCNMDWDKIRAVDLFVLFDKYLHPDGGFVRSVTIYPSEFGLQRMKEEEVKGPPELTEKTKQDETEDEDGEEGSAYHMEKLRQYQLNRLKYYYAVVVFYNADIANKIYTALDNAEYESTATKLDLRFIPDDMEFDQTPKEVCNKLPDFTKYEPRQFTTTALQQVKVQLTWDETNPDRVELTQKLNSGKLNEINKDDLQAYLATDSSDNESEEEKEKAKESGEENSDSTEEKNVDPIEKYKALLKEIEEKEEAKQKKDVELEFTWGWGAKEKAEKLVQERLKKDESLTPFEQYLEKRKEKKKAKREERNKRKNANKDALDSGDSDDEDTNDKPAKKDAVNSDSAASSDDEDEERRKAELELLMDENEDDKKHFSMKKIEENASMTKSKLKRLSKKKNGQDPLIEDNFEVNVQDPRFNSLFTSHHFNIDPADPHYKKTKGTEALIKEKLKRRADNNSSEETPTKVAKIKTNLELQALIKSVKQNTKNISKPIK